MARITHVKSAQQRYYTVPVIDPATGKQKVTPVMRRNGTQKTTKKGKPVELRVTMEDKTRPKPNHRCEKCGVEIVPGMPYKHVSPKSGPYGGHKRVRCATCPSWKPSELSSSKMAGVMAAEEALDAALSDARDVGTLESLRDEFADMVEAVGEEYKESAQNMEDGFGHETSMSSELREKGEQLKEWAESIRDVSFEDFDEDAAWDEVFTENSVETDAEDFDEDEAKAEWQDSFDAKADEHWDAQQEALTNETGNCPV